MSLPKISFIKGKSGLGRQLPGEDFISGFVFYDAVKPSGFVSGNSYVEKVLSLVDAENLGIVDTYTDETKATATITITQTGTTVAGQYLTISATDYSGVVDLGTYTTVGSLVASAETAAISAFINAGNYAHGYSSTVTGTTLTITPTAGQGEFLNTTDLTVTGDITNTKTAFAGGVASKLAQYHYQISEYFRIQPNGQLWVMFSDVPTTYFATELNTIQTAANGKLRQCAVFANAKTTITTADVIALNNALNAVELIFGVGMSVVYSTDLTGVANLVTLPDLSQLTCNKVSVVISQSFSGKGLELYSTTKKSVPTLGACLGTISLSKVSDDIAWVGQYNLTSSETGNYECEVAGFANGQLFSAISNQNLEQLNGFRYIFLRKFVGTTGTFWNDSHCAIGTDSDYSFIEGNRTIDKAIRVVRTALMPSLNAPIDLNADGTLSDVSIASFTSDCNFVLETMFRNGELSAYATVISADQNVLQTSTINISINIVPKGVARNIVVTIGFKTKL